MVSWDQQEKKDSSRIETLTRTVSLILKEGEGKWKLTNGITELFHGVRVEELDPGPGDVLPELVPLQ
jgi:hypothetical protein